MPISYNLLKESSLEQQVKLLRKVKDAEVQSDILGDIVENKDVSIVDILLKNGIWEERKEEVSLIVDQLNFQIAAEARDLRALNRLFKSVLNEEANRDMMIVSDPKRGNDDDDFNFKEAEIRTIGDERANDSDLSKNVEASSIISAGDTLVQDTMSPIGASWMSDSKISGIHDEYGCEISFIEGSCAEASIIITKRLFSIIEASNEEIDSDEVGVFLAVIFDSDRSVFTPSAGLEEDQMSKKNVAALKELHVNLASGFSGNGDSDNIYDAVILANDVLADIISGNNMFATNLDSEDVKEVFSKIGNLTKASGNALHSMVTDKEISFTKFSSSQQDVILGTLEKLIEKEARNMELENLLVESDKEREYREEKEGSAKQNSSRRESDQKSTARPSSSFKFSNKFKKFASRDSDSKERD